MDDRLSRLEKELCELAARTADLERRLTTLEAGASVSGQTTGRSTLPAGLEALPMPDVAILRDAPGTLALAGRLVIVVGGAFLLRALTEASTFPAAAGITLGMTYALIWIVAAGRAASKKLMSSGVFHAIAGCAIAFPLIWESKNRFHLFNSPMDMSTIAALTAICLFISCKYRFQPLAWFSVTGAVTSTLAMLPDSPSLVPPCIFLVVLGVVTLWLGYELGWKGLRWLVAGAVNLAVLGITYSALASHPRETPGAALLVQLVMLGSYLASIAIRTLVRERNVIPFEVVQVIAGFLLGFVGAVYTTRATGTGSGILGVAALVLGTSCYAVAFAFMDKNTGRARNFHFYTSLALLFVLTGSWLLLGGPALAVFWIALAILMSWLGWSHARFALSVHAAIAISTAALVFGIPGFILIEFMGPVNSITVPTIPQLLVMAGSAVCLAWPLPAQMEIARFWIRIQRFLVTLLFVSSAGGALISIAAALAGSASVLDAGIVATIRTIVMSVAALVLAWMGRSEKFEEWGWLLYPVLGATGLKMLVEDFPHSRPATLFLALAAYGCVLILSPRLRRQPPQPDN
jgi:hypothetical protein